MTTLLDRLPADEPRPRHRLPRDPKQPWIDTRRIAENNQALAKDENVILQLAEDIGGSALVTETRRELVEARLQNLAGTQPKDRHDSYVVRVVELLDGIRARCAEVSDCMDDAGREPERVNYRRLVEQLKAVERELDHAVTGLAASLGLVEVR